MVEHVLKQAGDNLTRENIMKTASSIKGLQIPMVLPGVLAANTTFESESLIAYEVGYRGQPLPRTTLSV